MCPYRVVILNLTEQRKQLEIDISAGVVWLGWFVLPIVL